MKTTFFHRAWYLYRQALTEFLGAVLVAFQPQWNRGCEERAPSCYSWECCLVSVGELMDFIGGFSGGFPATTNCFGFCFELRVLTWLVVILKQKQVSENPKKWISFNSTLIH